MTRAVRVFIDGDYPLSATGRRGGTEYLGLQVGLWMDTVVLDGVVTAVVAVGHKPVIDEWPLGSTEWRLVPLMGTRRIGDFSVPAVSLDWRPEEEMYARHRAVNKSLGEAVLASERRRKRAAAKAAKVTETESELREAYGK